MDQQVRWVTHYEITESAINTALGELQEILQEDKVTYRIGVDIGGTFTDFALVDDKTGDLLVHKQLTTPLDPSESVLSGIVAMPRKILSRSKKYLQSLTEQHW